MKKQTFIFFVIIFFTAFHPVALAEVNVYGNATDEKQYFPSASSGAGGGNSTYDANNYSLTDPGAGSNIRAGDPFGANDFGSTGANGGSSSGGGQSSGEGWSISTVSGFGLPSGSIYYIITGILEWLLALIGVIGVIGFLIAGGMYILSAGDEKQAGTAKAAMTNSIIGVIVALVGFVVIQAVDSMLNGYGWF